MANQFSRPDVYNDLRYSPESFKDLAIAPMALRERHDKALQFQDDMLFQMQNIKVPDDPRLQEEFARKKAEIEENVNNITNRINTSGAGSRVIMGDLRGLKRDYNKEVSASGFTGRAAGIKLQVDKEYEQFMAANAAAGHNPETGKMNWDIYKKQYMDNLSVEGLSDENKAVSEFKPTYAPKYENFPDKAKALGNLVGSISKENPIDERFETKDNGVGGSMLVLKQGYTMSESNQEGLDQINNFIKQEIGDKNSQTMQNLRYMHPGVPDEKLIKDYLKSMDPLIASQLKKGEATKQSISVIPISDGSGRGGGGDGKEPKPNTVELRSHDGGQKIIETMGFANLIAGTQIEELEEKERLGTITQDEIDLKKGVIDATYLVTEQMKDPSRKARVNANLAKNGSLVKTTINKKTGKKIKTPSDIDGYSREIASLDKRLKELDKKNAEAGLKTGGQNVDINARGPLYENLLKLRNKLKNELEEATDPEIDKEALKYNKIYTIFDPTQGENATATYLKTLNQDASSLMTIARNSGGHFTVNGDDENKDFNDELSDFKDFTNDINSGATSFTGVKLIDKGATGRAEIVLTYNTKRGNGTNPVGGELFIQYGNKSTNNDYLDGLLNNFHSILNTEGQAVIQSIKDNKDTSEISIDNEEFKTKGISDSQSESVVKANAKFSSSYNLTEDYKRVNYIKTDPKDPEFKNNKYNLVKKADNYHSLVMKKGGKEYLLSVNDWLNREFYKDYLDGKSNSNTLLGDTDQNIVKWAKDFTEVLSAPGGPISLGQKGTDGYIKYENLRKEYAIKLQNPSLKLPQQKEIATEFYDALKLMGEKLPISMLNKKRLL